MANETGGPEGAATEHEGAPLSELVSEEVGSADTWTLKVYMAFINEYTYRWNGKDVNTKKLSSRFCLRTPESTALALYAHRKASRSSLT